MVIVRWLASANNSLLLNILYCFLVNNINDINIININCINYILNNLKLLILL